MLNMDIAFDKKSYFNENAQNTIPIAYITKPEIRRIFFPSKPHFLKSISPATSSKVAIIISPKNTNFRVISYAIGNLGGYFL